ncbi:arylacetamide deacetylase-like 4 [Eublepharis macularius]|uniref:Arylacetamide deacetylase-like 4 n=1 Tax=Eublepharis macularius TaxID=481883 RepID=A0AA97LJI1_EUBMA|nr:arylacetamide deacetylase-like 4 [Eublepharis macularius]
MNFTWALSWLGTSLLIAFLLMIAWAVLYHISCTEIPSGMSQRFQLRCLHFLLIFAFGLVNVLRKLHVCSGDGLLRFLMDGIPPLKDPQLSIKDLNFDGVPVRMYQPKSLCDGGWRGVLYFHGGVGMYGSIDAYERVCRYIAKESNSLVVSVGYRLAPEHPYPAQCEDCLTATIYFMKNVKKYSVDPASILVSGDSSGGTIAASVCQSLVHRSDLPKIRAQVLIYPYLQAVDFNLPSYQRNSHVPLLFQNQVVQFGLQYLQKDGSLSKNILEGSHIPQEVKIKYSKWLGPENLPEVYKWKGYRCPQPTSDSVLPFEVMKDILDTRLSPLLAQDAVIQQLPEAYILTCRFDVFMDDGLLYKKRLEDNGVGVTWFQLEDGFHGIVFFVNHWLFSFSGCQRGINSIVNFIKGL